MHFPEPIRIISDLHLGYSGNLLTGAEQLRPLLDGIGTLICNGDTAELRLEARLPEARVQFEKLRSLCEEAGVQTVFINGNHDPAISEINHLDLMDGAVLVTHGDILFTDLAPWCEEHREIGKVHRKMLAEMDESLLLDLEARLRTAKDAILSVGLPELHMKQGQFARLAMFLKQCWPPTQPFEVLRGWRQAPLRAAALLREFRPEARFAVIGHVHRPGISRLPPRIVINTGSYTPLLGRLAVDIENGGMSVKRIVRKRGCFSAGAEVARFPITKLSPEEAPIHF